MVNGAVPSGINVNSWESCASTAVSSRTLPQQIYGFENETAVGKRLHSPGWVTSDQQGEEQAEMGRQSVAESVWKPAP